MGRTVTWDRKAPKNLKQASLHKILWGPRPFITLGLMTLKRWVFMSLPGLSIFKGFSKPRVFSENSFNLVSKPLHLSNLLPALNCLPPPIFCWHWLCPESSAVIGHAWPSIPCCLSQALLSSKCPSLQWLSLSFQGQNECSWKPSASPEAKCGWFFCLPLHTTWHVTP